MGYGQKYSCLWKSFGKVSFSYEMRISALLLLAALAVIAVSSPASISFGARDKLLASAQWMRALDRYSIPKSTSFRLMPCVFGSIYPDESAYLTLATQCSIESVHEVKDMAVMSDSRISVGVLILKDIGRSYQLVKRLRDCSPEIKSKVDFHFVFADGPDLYADFNVNTTQASFHDLVHAADGALDQHSCEDVLSRGFSVMYEAHANYVEKGIPYPVNLMRNVALRYITTPHVMIVDVDLVPSPNIGAEYARAMTELTVHQRKNASRIALVAPGESPLFVSSVLIRTAFELSRNESKVPTTKAQLRDLWNRKLTRVCVSSFWSPCRDRVQPFYTETCSRCHHPSNYKEWFVDKPTDKSQLITYPVSWRTTWEPFFGVSNITSPAFDIRFQQVRCLPQMLVIRVSLPLVWIQSCQSVH
jgi:hypothetical protein